MSMTVRLEHAFAKSGLETAGYQDSSYAALWVQRAGGIAQPAGGADPNARAATFGLDSALRLPFWTAVKTGTSKGMRDNWCVGFSRRYTVAGWVGSVKGDPMRAVWGTSGAVPVWRDVMLALNRDEDTGPPMPVGVERRCIAFADAIEQPRLEYFLRGTGRSLIAAAPATTRRARIVNPASGSDYAIDSDIPAGRQGVGIEPTGDVRAYHVFLDDRDLGPAAQQLLFFAPPGHHRLRPVEPAGHATDQVIVPIR